jgi:ubiquinone/menaquinone biosynthesis C-methylase UbiE
VDVGSGSLGITPYFKKPITGVDQDFMGPQSSLLHKIKGSALSLPLSDKSFDASICVDVLEHIQKKLRKRVIKELIRVSKKKVYIITPCESYSETEDKIIKNYIRRIHKSNDPFLEEHIKYGLPKEREVVESIPKRYKIKINLLTNIFLHRVILMAQFSNNRIIKFVSSVIFILFIPLFLKINFKPTYRKLFIITLDN